VSSYLDNLDKNTKEFFEILEPNFPKWLLEYIETKEMLHQEHISSSCGVVYSDLFKIKNFSSLDHSVSVGLIVWHFTKDKKQTLAGLFHDIATPVFKHCVDFMLGDYLVQEATEELTTEIIKNSTQITELLKRDGIAVPEVDDYTVYPIADNDTPKLSADRLGYSLANALIVYKLLSRDEIDEIYNDIEIQKNEEGETELGFKTKKLARRLVKVTSELSLIYREDRTRYSMEFLAEILRRLDHEGEVTKEDLYRLRESEIIKIIENSKYKRIFNVWKNAKKVKVSKEPPKGVYFVRVSSKIRYIDPLINGERISKKCKIAKKMIEKNLSYDMDNYVYLDLNFD